MIHAVYLQIYPSAVIIIEDSYMSICTLLVTIIMENVCVLEGCIPSNSPFIINKYFKMHKNLYYNTLCVCI